MKALEDAIVALIQGIDGLPEQAKVLPWPDQPLKLGRPVGSAAIMVRFAGENLRSIDTINRGPSLQNGNISIEIRILVKNLRTHSGAYNLLHSVHMALSGWVPVPEVMPKGYSPQLPGMQLTSSDLVDHTEAVWDWGQRYALPVTFLNKK